MWYSVTLNGMCSLQIPSQLKLHKIQLINFCWNIGIYRFGCYTKVQTIYSLQRQEIRFFESSSSILGDIDPQNNCELWCHHHSFYWCVQLTNARIKHSTFDHFVLGKFSLQSMDVTRIVANWSWCESLSIIWMKRNHDQSPTCCLRMRKIASSVLSNGINSAAYYY